MSPCFLIHLIPATCHGGAWDHLDPCHHVRCPQEGDKSIGLSLPVGCSGEPQALDSQHA